MDEHELMKPTKKKSAEQVHTKSCKTIFDGELHCVVILRIPN